MITDYYNHEIFMNISMFVTFGKKTNKQSSFSLIYWVELEDLTEIINKQMKRWNSSLSLSLSKTQRKIFQQGTRGNETSIDYDW